MIINNRIKKLEFVICLVFIIVMLVFAIYNKTAGKGKDDVLVEDKDNNDNLDKELKDSFEDSDLTLLEDYYGDWVIENNKETIKYARVSKSYTDDDIYKNVSINKDKVIIDGDELIFPRVSIEENIDEIEMWEIYRTNITQFDFKDDLCSSIHITDKGCILNFFTDGEKMYYYYSGTYFKMSRVDE